VRCLHPLNLILSPLISCSPSRILSPLDRVDQLALELLLLRHPRKGSPIAVGPSSRPMGACLRAVPSSIPPLDGEGVARFFNPLSLRYLSAMRATGGVLCLRPDDKASDDFPPPSTPQACRTSPQGGGRKRASLVSPSPSFRRKPESSAPKAQTKTGPRLSPG